MTKAQTNRIFEEQRARRLADLERVVRGVQRGRSVWAAFERAKLDQAERPFLMGAIRTTLVLRGYYGGVQDWEEQPGIKQRDRIDLLRDTIGRVRRQRRPFE